MSKAEAGTEYLTIKQACERYGFSRSTFYRMLGAPKSTLDEVVIRLPPKGARIRIPTLAFEAWLREQQT